MAQHPAHRRATLAHDEVVARRELHDVKTSPSLDVQPGLAEAGAWMDKARAASPETWREMVTVAIGDGIVSRAGTDALVTAWRSELVAKFDRLSSVIDEIKTTLEDNFA
ncbi:MAG: hypothetical protein EOO77_41535, partial [Oxalobacteraceae bacterium]